MELISEKFKYLKLAQKLLGPAIVPVFVKMSDDLAPLNSDKSYILRSALKGEASKQELLSGKSLSIGQLQNQAQILDALSQVKQQTQLEEVILQEEITWDEHITLITEENFFFAEIKNRSHQAPRYLYGTELGTSEQNDRTQNLRRQINHLKPLLITHKLWLMEWGYKDQQLFLFQIQPVEVTSLNHLFSQDLALQMLLSRHRFAQNAGLLNMIKTEWRAFLYRRQAKRKKEFGPYDLFLNWEFIFHYFRLYCLQHNQKPTENSLSQFLTQSHQKNWIADILRLHLAFANGYRASENYPVLEFAFHGSNPMNFIGRGQYQLKINDVCWMEELTPEKVYAVAEKSIILTKSISLLGHGVLAASERRLPLVTGISDYDWEKLRKAELIFLDFESKKLEVK